MNSDLIKTAHSNYSYLNTYFSGIGFGDGELIGL